MGASVDIPEHYRSYYLDLKAGKSLIRHLKLSCQCDPRSFTLQHGAVDEGLPPEIENTVNNALQWILTHHAPTLNEELLKALVPQVAFRDFLARRLKVINEFSQSKFKDIEAQIISIFRSMRNLSNIIAQQVLQKKQENPEGNASFNDAYTLNRDDNVYEADQKWNTFAVRNSCRNKTELPPDLTSLTCWLQDKLTVYEYHLQCCEAEIIHLDMFIRINYKQCIQLCHHFDKEMNSTIASWVSASLSREPFTNVATERLLIFISVAWEKWRNISLDHTQKPKSTSDSAWVPPDSFTRRTTKYWIKLEQVVRLKLAILRYVPYLIFGFTIADVERYMDSSYINDNQLTNHTDDSLTSTLKGRKSKKPGNSIKKTLTPSSRVSPTTEEPSAFREGQLITSIYFDSITGHCYKQRIMRKEGSELIRFRWYGTNNGEGSKPIYVEKKTHHESWTGCESTKERFMMQQKYIPYYITKQLTIEEYIKTSVDPDKKSPSTLESMLSLGNSIQESIQKFSLQSMLRTSYGRVAFQTSSSNEIRFSLDTNLCMVEEFISPFTGAQRESVGYPPWCRYGEEIHAKDEVIRFPYAVLEVKLQAFESPFWLSRILASSEAIMVYKFSKYQHGMALLYPALSAQHGYPHWFDEFVQGKQNIWLLLICFRSAMGSTPLPQNPIAATLYNKMELPYLEWPRASKILLAIARFFRYNLMLNFSSDSAPPLRPPQPYNSHALIPSPSNPRFFKLSLFPLSYTLPPDAHKTYNWNANIMMPYSAMSDANLSDVIMKRSRNIFLIDPKAFFASERTFLNYLEKALYLAGISLLLLNTPSAYGQQLGILVYIGTAVVMIMSYHVFISRCTVIKWRLTRESSMNSSPFPISYPFAVTVLCIIVTLSVLTALYFSFVSQRVALTKNFASLLFR